MLRASTKFIFLFFLLICFHRAYTQYCNGATCDDCVNQVDFNNTNCFWCPRTCSCYSTNIDINSKCSNRAVNITIGCDSTPCSEYNYCQGTYCSTCTAGNDALESSQGANLSIGCLWCNYNQKCFNAMLYPYFCPVGKILSSKDSCLSYNSDTKTYVAITILVALGLAATVIIFFVNKMNNDKNVEHNYNKFRRDADLPTSMKLKQLHQLVLDDPVRKVETKDSVAESDVESEQGEEMGEVMIPPSKKGKHARKISLTANNLRNLA